MANRNIKIEQLFEDIPNTALQASFASSGYDLTQSNKRSSSVRKEKLTTRITSAFNSTSSKSGTPTMKYRKSPESTAESPRSRSSTDHPNHENEIPTKFPISYEAALYYFGDKLTPFEHSEIVNYDSICFLGLAAAKIQVKNNNLMHLYDDDESFYKVVPHDHIAYRYEITERPSLGSGTFGQVIKAYDHKEKAHVAIKLVRNENIYLKQSRDELRILQLLKKQDSSKKYNIVHIKEFFMFRNHMCITFELLGMNLYQVLKKNKFKGLGTTKIQTIARCVLKCLELLCRNRIIHCDIKPENIMLKRNGDFSSVKVGDFGSSCYEQQQVYHYVQSRYYRAPEVMLGMRYGPAIDMWSLGCVLGELSSGYPIFVGDNEASQLSAIEEVLGDIPAVLMNKTKVILSRPRSINIGSPGTKPFSYVVHGDDHFKDFVRQMLEWNPQIRPSPTEVQDHKWLKARKTS